MVLYNSQSLLINISCCMLGDKTVLKDLSGQKLKIMKRANQENVMLNSVPCANVTSAESRKHMKN